MDGNGDAGQEQLRRGRGGVRVRRVELGLGGVVMAGEDEKEMDSGCSGDSGGVWTVVNVDEDGPATTMMVLSPDLDPLSPSSPTTTTINANNTNTSTKDSCGTGTGNATSISNHSFPSPPPLPSTSPTTTTFGEEDGATRTVLARRHMGGFELMHPFVRSYLLHLYLLLRIVLFGERANPFS